MYLYANLLLSQILVELVIEIMRHNGSKENNQLAKCERIDVAKFMGYYTTPKCRHCV